MNIAIIGGGAAGFFAALSAKEHHPEAVVTIYEKSKNLLSKVKISGGGRCNVTNGETDIKILAKAYPRGEKKLRKALYEFNTQHTMDWFESRGVALVTQEDGCVFPVSQDSQTIIDCFLSECERLGISIKLSCGVKAINPTEEGLELDFGDWQKTFDKVIVATGGTPMRKGMKWLEDINLQIEDPVPSLFTFNMPDENITELMGIVVKEALTNIQGTKLKGDGPLLITHWGMSGPAILKLSAFGARILNESSYKFKVQVNWVNEVNNEEVSKQLEEIINNESNKILANYRPYLLPERLWHFLIDRSGLSPRAKWNEIGKKGLNRLINILTNDVYQVSGKTTFKEEFVTCGGISLESINFKTMASREYPNLYFAGELTDVDGITGGYNFQSAWTTGYIAGRLG
ncbi:MAG: putative Rossmann fold flavoprotein [Halioglobus sp.]|jgi:predicted Rossmann fold flavoprotein